VKTRRGGAWAAIFSSTFRMRFAAMAVVVAIAVLSSFWLLMRGEATAAVLLLSLIALIVLIGFGFLPAIEKRDRDLAELRRLNEELKASMEVRTRQFERINQELTDAVSIVAHDVRGPVSGIRTLARHMRWAGLDLSAAEGNELLGEIERTSAEAVEMMGRLLDLQRASQRAVGYVKADVGHLVADMCRHYEIAANEKGIALKVTRPGREMMHLVDADGLKFIVSNLVSNALKFLPAGGTVEVRLCESFTGSLLVVADNGPGISERELPTIFNRFSKAANRPTAGESSSGLGLFIVRKLVLAMGGTLYVESIAGEGATFVVEWPAEAIRAERPEGELQSL
jgi:signal transduction histidine kinase